MWVFQPLKEGAALQAGGAAEVSAALDADALATLTAAGEATATAVLDSDAAASVTWSGEATAEAVLDSDAAATVEWVGAVAATVEAAEFDADAAASVTWSGEATATAVLDSDAAASVTWSGEATVEAVLDSDAAASVTWSGEATAEAVLDTDAAATLTWDGAEVTVAEGEGELDADAAAALTMAGEATATAVLDVDAAATLTMAGAATATAALDAVAAAALTWDGAEVTADNTAPADLEAASTAALTMSGAVPARTTTCTFSDTFNGESGTVDLAAHNPSGGIAWVLLEGPANAALVTAAGALRNNSSSLAGSFYACDDVNDVDHFVQYTVQNTNIAAFVVNRCSNVNNFIGVRVFGGRVELYRRVNGTFTQLGLDGPTSVSVGDVIRFESEGDTHRVYLNGNLEKEETSSHNNTVTTQGIIARNSGDAAWMDNFSSGCITVPDTDTFLTWGVREKQRRRELLEANNEAILRLVRAIDEDRREHEEWY